MDLYNLFYVYAYIGNSGKPYYIGKGKNRRAWEKHININRPNDKSKIVILESKLSEIGAWAIERRMISWWGRKDINTGILQNKSDGGEGNVGKIGHSKGGRAWTEEEKRKKSESMLGEKNVCFGRIMSEEQKTRLKQFSGEKHHGYGKPSVMAGKNHTEESKRKMSESQRKRPPVSEETRLRRSISMKLAHERRRTKNVL